MDEGAEVTARVSKLVGVIADGCRRRDRILYSLYARDAHTLLYIYIYI